MRKQTVGRLEFFTFDNFLEYDGVTCAVTTRAGGFSEGDTATFNLGMRAGDDPGVVIDNRAQLSLVTSAFPDLLTFGRQVHGRHVEVVSGELIGSGASDPDNAIPDTDAMVTGIADVPLVVLVADCAAVSLYDPVKKAVGLAHAGWRGTAAGIAAATVAKMTETFATDPADLVAGIGPSIGPCCYEVGNEVADRFSRDFPDIADKVLVGAPDGGGKNKVHLDLWKTNKLQLAAAGVREDRIEVAGLCTSCNTDTFYSYRAGLCGPGGGHTGRFASLVMLHDKTRRVY